MTAFQTQREADHGDSPSDNATENPFGQIVVPHRMLIGSGLLMGFGGLILSIVGSTSGESVFDGVRSAAILMLFALLASFENRPRLIGVIGYYLGLIGALVFGLNFARLGWKWFEPSNWTALSPPIALIMGGTCLFSFYKICRARREYVGGVLAVCVTIGCVVLSKVWNGGQGLIAIDSSYSVALFLVLVGAMIWRFQTAITIFFRDHLSEKLELAPIVLIAVFAVAGAIKLAGGVVPEGAIANLTSILWPTDEPTTTLQQSASSDARTTSAETSEISLPEHLDPMHEDAP